MSGEKQRHRLGAVSTKLLKENSGNGWGQLLPKECHFPKLTFLEM